MTRVTGLAKERLLASEMSEKDLQDCIIQLAKALGYLVHAERAAINRRGHWSTPIQGKPGYPDITIIGYGHKWLWECKSEGGKTTLEQENWLREAGKAGFRIGIIKPHNWLSGDVEKELREAKEG